MAQKQCISVPGAPKPGGPMSHVVRYGNLLFLAGHIGRNPADRALVQGMGAQTSRTLENIKTLLEAAGSSLDKVLSATVYITDMSRKEEMNEAYKEFFRSDPPARTTVGVKDLGVGVEVEITVIAGVD